MNKQFLNKGFNLASKLPESTVSLFESMYKRNNHSFVFRKIEEEDIYKIIENDLSSGKSAGHDNIHAIIIKWSAPIIVGLLIKIF